MSKSKIHRSAVTGQFVTEDFARKHPRETVSEASGKKKKRKK